MVDDFGYPNAYKDFSAKRPLYPLHSAMRMSGPKSLQPAKTVSFSLPDVTAKKHDILQSEWSRSPASHEAKAQPIQDMEAAKQAVAFIMGIPEVIVQLVIDAHHLDLDPDVSFKDAEELAKVAMEVAQSPQRQADLAMKVHQVRKENKHGDKTGVGGAEGLAKSGAGVWASKDGCESLPSEMLAGSKTQIPSSGAAPSPSCSPCPSSSSSSFSSDASSSTSSSSSSTSLLLSPPTTNSSANSSAHPGCCLSEMSVVETSTGITTYDKQEKQISLDASSNSPSSTQHADDSSDTGAEPGSDKQPVAISASESGKAPASILPDPQHHPGSSLEPPKESAQDLHPTDATESLKQQLRKRVQRLAVENRKLKNRKVCRACLKVDLAESGITFLPCGHFITCESCSEMFDDCPACGKNIMGTVRTFLS